jgi:flavin-dependent dehydrogenase
MYDVIVVGTRVAGATTAMLLARAGLRVLAVDRASFPSDTISTHQVQLPGIAALRRFGLYDKLLAPPTREITFDVGDAVLRGRFPAYRDADALHSPRRTGFDAMLVDAARAAGAEVRSKFAVDELTFDGDRVTGIRGEGVTEKARLVIGADGKHSLVARSVGARVVRSAAPRTLASYTYFSGVSLDAAELYGRPNRVVGAWPTEDGLIMTYVAGPIAEFPDFRADIEGNLLKTLDQAGDLGMRVRAGERAERIRTTPDLPNEVRRAYGPGWALVGDAGFVMDPITGAGIGHALCQAESLAAAVVAGSSLASFERARDDMQLPMFDFTLDLASFRPDTSLFVGLQGKQDAIDRFFGVLGGAISPKAYFTPGNLLRILGPRGLAKVMLGRMRR